VPARANLRPSPRRPPRWRTTLVVAVLLAAAGCSGAADAPGSPRSTQPPPAPTGTTVPAFDRGRFAAVIPVSGAGNMAVADGRLWVLDAAGTVVRVDPESNRVVGKPLRVPADAEAIAVGERALWVTRGAPGDLAGPRTDTVTRIDPTSGRTVATIRLRGAPLDVAATPGAVWVTNSGGDSVVRIDPATNRVVGPPIPIGFRAGNLVVGAGDLWVTSDYRVDAAAEDVVVVRIDPQANRAVETIAVGGHPIDVAATQGAVWVSVADPGTVLRIPAR
jgi:DNA-binding beta-propeller fold protein YncE